jgi:hypothetical protein
LKSLADFKFGEMKFPETRIGETVVKAGDWLAKSVQQLEMKSPETGAAPSKFQKAANVAGRDPRRVAQLVSVRYVVEGSYRRVGERVRVSARLLALPAGDQRWGRVYDRPRDSLATLSDAIAQDLASELAPGGGAAAARRAERRPPDPRAYEAYQRGRFSFLRYDIPTARALFEQCVRIDPTNKVRETNELDNTVSIPIDVAAPAAGASSRRTAAVDLHAAMFKVPLLLLDALVSGARSLFVSAGRSAGSMEAPFKQALIDSGIPVPDVLRSGE